MFDFGDEREQGYEDEDDSMELSDEEDTFSTGGQKDGDTTEDVMNPLGKTAPPAPVQDYSRFYAHGVPAPDHPEARKLHLDAIEKQLEEHFRKIERAAGVAATDGAFDIDALNPGIPSQTLAVDKASELKTLQEDIGMHPVEDGKADVSAPKVSTHREELDQPTLTT